MYGTVSVVVPVYNVEKYIRECLDSIVNQTYKNLQIILVDDGSTDSSGNICDEYAQKDSRITVVHQKNGGAGAAKNVGLDRITGEYFMIIDSDDYLDTGAVEYLIDTMNKKEVDIVQYLLSYTYVDGKAKYPNLCIDHNDAKITADDFLLGLLSDWKYAIFANKLFKTNLLKDIRFLEGNAIDDEFFTYKVICNASSVFVSNEQLYYYRMRKSSVMKDNRRDRLISDRVDCFTQRYEFIKEQKPQLSKCFYEHLSDILLFYKTQASDDELNKKLDHFIKIYPYRKPNILRRLFNNKPKTIKFSMVNGFTLFD